MQNPPQGPQNTHSGPLADPDGAPAAASPAGASEIAAAPDQDVLAELDAAVEQWTAAVAAVPAGHPERATCLFNLGMCLYARFNTTRDVRDIDKAIDAFRQSLEATPADHPERPKVLFALSSVLSERFALTNNTQDQQEAIDIGRQAVEATPADHPGHGRALFGLGDALLRRFQTTSNTTDLDEAIDFARQAVQATAENDPLRPQFLFALASALLCRFETGRATQDLDEAIDTARQAAAAVFPGHPKAPAVLSLLGASLLAQFERTGSTMVLDQSVQVFREAVAITPAGDHDWPGRLSNLANALRARFENTSRGEDLDEAIALGRQALAAAPAGHPDRPAALCNLGNALRIQFEHRGAAKDLDEAISLGWESVAVTPENVPDRPGYVSNVGIALWARFGQTGSTEDLNQAVTAFREAVAATPAGHHRRPMYLSNIANALLRRFETTASQQDLDEAIEAGQQAVTATPDTDPDRPRYLSNLAIALLRHFETTASPADLDHAIGAAQQALTTTPADHPYRPRYLANLAIIWWARFKTTLAAHDRDEAINAARQAVKATPTENPERAGRLINLAQFLQNPLRPITSPQDIGPATQAFLADRDEAHQAFREAAAIVSAPVDVRASAAREWGRSAAAKQDWADAVEGYSTAVELLSFMVPRGLARADQERRLTELAGLGSEAAAACLEAGLSGRAVELFEQGRGVLFSQILDARSDLTDLQTAHPQLAAEFVRCRDVLDRPEQDPSTTPSTGADPARLMVESEAERRRTAAAAFDRVLTEIRALPGFERFLAARPVAELLPAAAQGPVVLVNVAPLRSDALILTPAGVQVLPLPGVNEDTVAQQATTFLDAVRDLYGRTARPATPTEDTRATPTAVHGGPAANLALPSELRDDDEIPPDQGEEKLATVLGWLSDQITTPVLDHLGYTSTPTGGQTWPQMWWCPSGKLALLPLHAAGHHSTSAELTDAVIDRVVSSTTPTVRTLLHARHAPPPPARPRVLVVAMPHTPGQKDLPGAALEADTLHQLLPGQVDVLGLTDTAPATYDAVRTALPTHPWVHFACHGDSDLANPDKSSLLLTDYRHHRLTVLDLTRARLEAVELAFLSACTTARTGLTLPDEPIHLAAACQLAGYRHVIASLWPIGDADTATLTTDFYTTLTAHDTATDPAVALHHATRALRSQHRDQPSHWAPYTHTGP